MQKYSQNLPTGRPITANIGVTISWFYEIHNPQFQMLNIDH